MYLRPALSVAAVAALLVAGLSGTAQAAGRDSDGDGIPNRWEVSHGMDPSNAADARGDFDRDGLNNLREYRQGTRLRDEDTDDDGHDDGDEVLDGYASTRARTADTDGDDVPDGDEDADHDGVGNEDEDDSHETCARDDDDRDGDSLDDEDENDLGLDADDADSDDNGVDDGDEDADEDGEANEDGDDSLDDDCDGDSDEDGEDDEDEDDLLGTIASFDAETGLLVVSSPLGFTVSGTVTVDTRIEWEDREDDESEGVVVARSDEDEATTADLQPGVEVAELEFEDQTDAIEEVEIYPPLLP